MLKRLNFSIKINASKEKVWNVLFTDENYPKWAKVFCEGSQAKTDWEEGSSVEFSTPEGDGMFSKIEQRITNELMVFKHLGVIEKGRRLLGDEKSKSWQNARESYKLTEKNETTELSVFMDTTNEYADYFNETFPKALNRIKELSEQN